MVNNKLGIFPNCQYVIVFKILKINVKLFLRQILCASKVSVMAPLQKLFSKLLFRLTFGSIKAIDE